MDLREQLRVLVAGIGSVLAVALYTYFLNTNVPPLASALFGIGATVFFVSLAPFWLLDLPLSYRWYRKRFDPRARYEGYWLIHVEDLPQRRFAIGRFCYHADGKKYLYYGHAINPDANRIVAGWKSTFLAVDLSDERVAYTLRYSRLSNQILNSLR